MELQYELVIYTFPLNGPHLASLLFIQTIIKKEVMVLFPYGGDK
jgi:hypothetical protein